MNLRTSFNDDLILEYGKRGSSPLFEIYWEHKGIFYPEEDWLDFGVVVLGWWLVGLRKITSYSTHESFPFMDGPYGFDVSRVENLLKIKTRGKISEMLTWTVGQDEFIEEILYAATMTIEKMNKLNIAVQEIQGLKKGIADIKKMNF